MEQKTIKLRKLIVNSEIPEANPYANNAIKTAKFNM